MTSIKTFLIDDRGATAIEYGVLSGVVGISLIGVATVLKTRLGTSFQNISNKLASTQGLS